MLAASVALPDVMTPLPPVVLVHGAANSAGVWRFWQQKLARRGWPAYAIDLRGRGHSGVADLAVTTMAGSAADVQALTWQLSRPPILIGWSTGGLVAMMVAAAGRVAACVGLAPSLPSRQVDESVPLRVGTFGPEDYGIGGSDPAGQPAMPDLDREERLLALASLGREPRLARDERRRGIVIEGIACPPAHRYRLGGPRVAAGTISRAVVSADRLMARGASHWGLVLNGRALAPLIPAVVHWMARAAAPFA